MLFRCLTEDFVRHGILYISAMRSLGNVFILMEIVPIKRKEIAVNLLPVHLSNINRPLLVVTR